MVAAQVRTPFGEPIRKPPQQSQPKLPAPGGIRNVGNKIGGGTSSVGSISRKPLAQQQQKPGGNISATSGKKKKLFDGGCCKAKKKPGVKKAAPPKAPKGSKKSLSSFFSRKKKSTDGSLLSSKRSTASSKGPQSSRFSKLGIRSSLSRAPPAPKQSSSRVTTTSAQQIKQQPQQQKVPLGGAAKPKEKNDKKKNVKKEVPSKVEIKKSQSAAGDSPKKSEKELKTGREDSVKEIKKKPKSTCGRKNSKSLGRDLALESLRNFQEVKVCIANLDNGMTERKVVLTSIYPHDQPPKPYITNIVYPRRKKSSYTTLKNANSIERMPAVQPSSEDDLLKSPDRSVMTVHRAPTASASQQFPLVPTSSKYPSTLYRDRALSTIVQLRGHYQLTNDEIRILSKNPDLKIITMRAGISLQEAQRNLRNLKILAGKHLLPDLTLFSDELSVVILELDRFIDAIHTVSEHADPSPKGKKYCN